MKDVFKALGDESRREILTLLSKGPMSAGDITAHFNMTGATISHHLSVLKESGLVTDTKSGKYIYYQLDTSVMDDILIFLYKLRKKDNED